MNVTLVDYGAGNVASVELALRRLGVETQRASTAECIHGASILMLPGVGHFGALIRALDQRGLRTPLREALERDVPFLGICLGLQALYDSSDEAPALRGLQLLPGQIHALPQNVKLPHMGWSQVRTTRHSRLLHGIESGAHFYFAHSYAAVATERNYAVATCKHGAEFVAVLEKKNISAVQFHPEKSGIAGTRLLQNFLELSA